MIFSSTDSTSVHFISTMNTSSSYSLTSLVLVIHTRLHDARVYDENEIGQRLVVIRALVLPALLKKIVELVPLFKLEYCFKLQFDDLKVLRDDVCLSRTTELVDALCGNSSELLTMLASLEIVLQL